MNVERENIMYEIFYKKEMLEKYEYLKNTSLYADKIKHFEQLVERNPFKNEVWKPCNDLINFKYVEFDENVTIQYYIDEKDESVYVYLIDIKRM